MPRRNAAWLWMAWALAAAVYQQGAGLHSGANMFKHVVEDAAMLDPDAPDAVLLRDGYAWMRTTWEHYVAHYLYAAGAVLVSFTHAYAYRDYQPTRPVGAAQKALLLCAAVLYALVIASVAVEFPKGTVVALLLIVIYGWAVLGTFLVRRKQVLSIGTRPVIQYFFYSYCVAFIIVLGWMIHVKGISNRVESSGGHD
ncbi:hypothetical protein SeMB42_g06563 [Synchytrium endobioticum]|nr:hypothetical protein SeMB42_g06563 [Synchytrium endobioticum]